MTIFLAYIPLLSADIYPIQFAMPEAKVVHSIPPKDQDFAHVIPGDYSTYIFNAEQEYYHDYQRSYFAFTWKKGGWDCLRHYEILANGCIPYFVNLEQSDPQTMYFLPKELIMEAMLLPGVHYGKINHTLFDHERYYEILSELLEHTRKYLTSKQMASYLLETIQYTGSGKILFLSQDLSPDYMRCLTLIGLKELLAERVVDVPKIPHIYRSYSFDTSQLYGKGMTYTKVVDDFPIDRDNIEDRIRNKEFDLIIFGSFHRGLPFHELILQTYPSDAIVYICGEDSHICSPNNFRHFFLREMESLQ